MPASITIRRCLVALAAAAAAGLAPLAAQANDDNCASGPAAVGASTGDFSLNAALRIVGLTGDGQLVCFSDKQPGKVKTIGSVNGLSTDTRLLAIDFRPQDGLLYGLGNAGGLYTVDTTNALVSLVGRLTVELTGASTTIDFNPAANALRIIGSNGQNLRQPFATMPLAATANDGRLNFNITIAANVANADPTVTTTTTTATTSSANFAAGIVGAAYINNDVDTRTATALFVLDATADRIALQSPANSGFLVPTGNLGVNASGVAGFDIYSVVRGGVTVAQRALAALNVGGTVGLYDVDPLTGAASPRGAIGSASPVESIAIPLLQN